MNNLLIGLATSIALMSVSTTAESRTTPCAVRFLTTLPLGNDSLFLHVPTVLNDHQRDMIIDTGSEGSLITPDAADRLALPVDPLRRTLIHGPNGRSDLVANRLVSSFRLGTVGLGAWSLPLGILPNLPKSLSNLAGLVGANILQPFAVELDAPHKTLRLWQIIPGPQRCTSAPPVPRISLQQDRPWVKLVVHRRGIRFNVGFTLDGADGNALIDSGARSITLSRRFANMMGISNATLEKDRGGVTSGVDLNARRFYWHKFDQFTLHAELPSQHEAIFMLKKQTFTVTDIDDDADMLLGADWLARHDVWISFPTSEIWVR